MNRFHAAKTRANLNSTFDLIKMTWESHSWGQYKFEKGFLIMEFLWVFMADFDLPPEGQEVDGIHYTVGSLEEIDQMVTKCAEHTGLRFRGYVTPSGGAHIFCVSKPIAAHDAAYLWEQLSVDQFYRAIVERNGYYACRVTPKPKRMGDFVARYWKDWNDHVPTDQGVMELMNIHDNWLAKYHK